MKFLTQKKKTKTHHNQKNSHETPKTPNRMVAPYVWSHIATYWLPPLHPRQHQGGSNQEAGDELERKSSRRPHVCIRTQQACYRCRHRMLLYPSITYTPAHASTSLDFMALRQPSALTDLLLRASVCPRTSGGRFQVTPVPPQESKPWDGGGTMAACHPAGPGPRDRCLLQQDESERHSVAGKASKQSGRPWGAVPVGLHKPGQYGEGLQGHLAHRLRSSLALR